MPWVGLKNLVYSIQTKDDATGVTYGAVKPISEALSANINTATNSATNYADDGPTDVATALGETTISLNVRDLPTQVQADLLGHMIGADGTLIKSKDDVAPYVAIGFKTKLASGGYGYKWYYKGKFKPQSETYESETDTPKFQNPTIEGTFITRKYDGKWQIQGRDDDAGFIGADTWFNAVHEDNADTVAPTVTVSPVDGATAVATSSSVVWTFDKAIQKDSVNDANFFLMDSLGTVVAGTLTLDGTGKVVTLDPTAALSSAMDYTAIATKNVRSISGYPMAANSVTNFATA